MQCSAVEVNFDGFLLFLLFVIKILLPSAFHFIRLQVLLSHIGETVGVLLQDIKPRFLQLHIHGVDGREEDEVCGSDSNSPL